MKRFFAFATVLILTSVFGSPSPGTVPTQKEPPGASSPDKLPAKTGEPETFVFTYEIMSGDSPSLIAHRFGINLKKLMNANIIKDGIIYKGDIMGVPLERSRIAEFHSVSEGETLSSIAQLYGTSVESIMKLNRMDGDTVSKSRKIVVHRTRKPKSRFVVFKAGSGDTPGAIAGAFGVSVKDIERMNASNPNWRERGAHIVVDTFLYRYAGQTRESILETASAYLGSPYKYGGNSTETGIDCSAYVKKVFSFFGVDLPRTVRMMHRHAKGQWIDKNRLEKGDLVFFETDRPFPSHIGIYMGGGNFIHASSVQGKVAVSNLAEPYYVKTYIGAKRIYIGNQNMVASRNPEERH